ncbi:MAG: GGDEF domain-containing protein, partial [Pseudomonadota bacterium]|nr:GGDEF domain-containing protein [Pseudomonadota bacterium]
MVEPVLSVLLIDPAPALKAALAESGFDIQVATPAQSPLPVSCDAVLLHAPALRALQALVERSDWPPLAAASAVLVVTEEADAAVETELIRRGVQGIVRASTELPRIIRQAVLRRRVEAESRLAYATDLATGLPHEAQLLEHMTQLLALRERQPAPMVLIVLRVEGVAQATARLGGEAGNILRRKIAVRLRSGLRASDVVAAMGLDTFGVLLGHLEAAADGEQVAAKLVRSLQQPLSVSGQTCQVRAALGLARFPQHGKDARTLIQRATAQAASVATDGRAGHA